VKIDDCSPVPTHVIVKLVHPLMRTQHSVSLPAPPTDQTPRPHLDVPLHGPYASHAGLLPSLASVFAYTNDGHPLLPRIYHQFIAGQCCGHDRTLMCIHSSFVHTPHHFLVFVLGFPGPACEKARYFTITGFQNCGNIPRVVDSHGIKWSLFDIFRCLFVSYACLAFGHRLNPSIG
jgi:hypothetical protein